ncbi:hypothetical protein A2773_03960 [Candidatus Gottesmanbacteria bacterium RIFCSPHIGHO2_01_FULL_39_10]|uniref:Transglycosylase SLT domain-containing protein n=1 Tax=Candidatus Gottesmanbacteria bacterium RIFCSPHIGHO2_01_FULL_39_10 TaxID=1798375 RepID=A0A1F5ZRM1_9BACT|nr:MAG: hypothetical protein A2773_03960 [Candidatus Gottesmanbacteria bacterium RIFCSPHIGHO2_01_FULL_39_10]
MFQSILLFASIAVLVIGSGGKGYKETPEVKGVALEYTIITETPIPTQTPSPTPIPPTPLPTAIPVSSQEIDVLFEKYGQTYGVDKGLLVKISYCESKHNPSARAGDYGGLFQFSTSSWISTRNAMSQDNNPDLRFHPEESIKTAAYKINAGGLSSWPVCGK